MSGQICPGTPTGRRSPTRPGQRCRPPARKKGKPSDTAMVTTSTCARLPGPGPQRATAWRSSAASPRPAVPDQAARRLTAGELPPAESSARSGSAKRRPTPARSYLDGRAEGRARRRGCGSGTKNTPQYVVQSGRRQVGHLFEKDRAQVWQRGRNRISGCHGLYQSVAPRWSERFSDA